MRTHELKIFPSQFGKVVSGAKPWEFRFNDRDYTVGDKLVLQEWEPGPGRRYTGNKITVDIIDVAYGGRFDIPIGYCILTIKVQK